MAHNFDGVSLGLGPSPVRFDAASRKVTFPKSMPLQSSISPSGKTLPAENRVGCFTVTEYLLREKWPDLVQDGLFARLVVVDIVRDYARRTVTYTAFSELFDVNPPNVSAPEYTPILSKTTGSAGNSHVTVSWKKTI